MYRIKRTDAFATWLDGIKDRPARARLIRRLEKAARGNLGDVRPVGQGTFEMREHFGPGWRMYYTRRGDRLIIMLGGGTKADQQREIDKAIRIARTLED